MGEVIRAVEGPLASVRGESPENVDYRAAAEPLRTVWVAVRASLRAVVDALLPDMVRCSARAPPWYHNVDRQSAESSCMPVAAAG